MIVPIPATADAVIRIEGLSRRFGAKAALDNVSLTVPRGLVFGMVGANGAGKTTLIKHVLGLLRAETGTVRVFGLDPVADPVGVLSRIGYLAEENELPGWMRVGELLRYIQAFYPDWDAAYAEDLHRTFGLCLEARLNQLSKGQRARAALLVAVAHRPELLVLDEPSSGLDPIARRDILGAVVRTVAEEGRTVLFSSHLLHEVERVADHVTMLDQGQVVVSATLDDLKENHRRLTVRFPEPRAQPPALDGALAWEGAGQEWTALCRGRLPELQTAVIASGARIVEQGVPSLDEIFVAQVGRRYAATVEE